MDDELPWKPLRSRHRRHLPVDVQSPSKETSPFASNDEILDTALQLFRAREEQADKLRVSDENTAEKVQNIRTRVLHLTTLWHNRVKLTPVSVSLIGLFTKHRLNQLEREILVGLVMHPLGLWPRSISDVGDVLHVLSLPTGKTLKALRGLSETGKLYRLGLIYYDDPDDDLHKRNVTVDSSVVDMILHDHSSSMTALQVKTEDELQRTLARVTRVLQKKADNLDSIIKGYGSQSTFEKWNRKSNSLLTQLDKVFHVHPKWTLAQMRTAIGRPDDWAIILTLIGKVLGHVDPENELFRGAGLARAACIGLEEYNLVISRLLSDAPLLKRGFVQPCGGIGSLLSESTDSIKETEFELTNSTLQSLGLDSAQRLATKRDNSFREPRVHLSDLALLDKTMGTIKLALDHVRGADTIMKQWGLADSFPYGRGATMLFYGPPGTGKTATAEAIACELGKPLLVADYSQIQNCFVGQTEKNIVSVFRKAQHRGAVLFWDEADAMFFDRDTASRTWEVRDVNVLLQEIERFEGVCILATNRKMTLDKALERRITAKIEFPRPTQELREAIWKKLIPKTLPLGKDVDFSVLSTTDLAGGEIKNVVLNASRYAFGRCPEGPVKAEDFRKAIEMETEHRWSKSSHHPIGFRHD